MHHAGVVHLSTPPDLREEIAQLCIIAFIGEDLTLTPAQELRETREWLAQRKRDPFLWIIILMPLTLAVFHLVGFTVLSSAFPRADAKRAIESVSPSVRIAEIRTFFCKLPLRGISLQGADL